MFFIPACFSYYEIVKKCITKHTLFVSACFSCLENVRKYPTENTCFNISCFYMPEIVKKCITKRMLFVSACFSYYEIVRKCITKRTIFVSACFSFKIRNAPQFRMDYLHKLQLLSQSAIHLHNAMIASATSSMVMYEESTSVASSAFLRGEISRCIS